jgi:hypothetical protein
VGILRAVPAPNPTKGSPFINAIERKAAKVVRERRASRIDAAGGASWPSASSTSRRNHASATLQLW